MSEDRIEADLNAALAAARRETGLEDLGAPEVLDPLRRFIEQCRLVPFNEAGRSGAQQQLHRWLINRLRIAHDLRCHPEILDEDVSDPIVVLGFPRSGTTMFQRMMSANPEVQSLLMWKVMNPAPFPGEDLTGPVNRIAFAKAVEDHLRAEQPGLFAAHPMIADDAEEDWFLHHLSLQHVSSYILAPSYEYLNYLRGLSRLPTYHYVADILRYLQWQDGGRRGRKWILKSPVHIGNIEEILACHPGAMFVYLMRDFETVVASNCNVTEEFVYKPNFRHYDPRDIGAITLDFWGEEMHRFREARLRLGSALNIVELPYQDVLRDPIRHIRHIFERSGNHLSTAGATSILNWIASNPQGKHGRSEYSLERYGLTGQMVEEKLGSDANGAK